MQVGIELLSKIPPENRREFIQSFKMLPHYEGCAEHCIYHKLFEDIESMNNFLWVEHWTSKKTLDKYLQSNRFKTLLGAIETLGELIKFKIVKIN